MWFSSWRSSTADLKSKILPFVVNNSRRRFDIVVLSYPVFFFARHATLWHTCPFIYTDALNTYYKSTTLEKNRSNLLPLFQQYCDNVKQRSHKLCYIFNTRTKCVFKFTEVKPWVLSFFLSEWAPALSFKKALITYILLILYNRHPILVNGTRVCYGQNIRQKIKGWLFHQHVILW